MISRLHLSSFIGLTVGIWLLALWFQGMPVLSSEFIKPFSLVVGTISVFVTVFNKYLWSWKIFRGWYVDRPDLRGTWKLELKSDWINPNTGKPIPTILGFVTIRQTLTSLTFRLFTTESESKSIAYSIEKEEDDQFKLNIIYQNQPEIELQGKKSEIHHGSFMLKISGNPPSSLKGHYWTDRGTRGTIILNDRIEKTSDNYNHAKKQYEENNP
ncbi:hypothetical protein EHR01_10590 [Leptospira mtsangambouensis]|uniref:CD-NTase-associated protein 15 domain-containing protein n=1 Tax=Leptospira mtsangambouensis TaxID=2484912 RepID=A0ABY2NZ20_9LEPT|nr:hypothetical protein [Leptospira mtsangambouensis]TGM74399.1 hypothetical protein EHR01_10590 [Leptospira mtsangambouensis]